MDDKNKEKDLKREGADKMQKGKAFEEKTSEAFKMHLNALFKHIKDKKGNCHLKQWIKDCLGHISVHLKSRLFLTVGQMYTLM